MTAEVALTFSALFTIIVTLILTGLGWRVKGAQDSKIASLNSELDRQLHAQKLTFDRKFKILSELWSAFIDLRRSTLDLTASGLTLHPVSETEEDRVKQENEKYREFSKHVVCFWDLFQKNRPFYPQEIYDMLLEVSTEAQAHGIIYLTTPPYLANQQYWKIQEEHAKKIIDIGEPLCNAIRKEILGQNNNHASGHD